MIEEKKPEKQPGQKQRVKVIGAAVLLCVVISLLVMCVRQAFPAQRYEPPVISGVKEQLVVYADENVEAALLDGVTAQGGADREGQTFQVLVTVYDEHGSQTSDYLPGTYRLVYSCVDRGSDGVQPVESELIIRPADTEPPVITGARDLTVAVGQTISYREGVTVTDDQDEDIRLQVDASAVDLTQTGEYPVTYSASDARGNEASVTVTVTVVETLTVDDSGQADLPPSNLNVTEDDVYALADRILNQITTAGMSQLEKAKAIFDYVHNHIKYVGTSDKSSWVIGAYIGFTRGSGDCFNYFACSKALLTRAGIPNVDLQRVGGTTRHYWQLVNTGSGYYHFDSCPHPTGYPLYSFMLTEAEARAYTEQVSPVRQNYFVYDYASCPVTVVGTPEAELPATPQEPVEETAEPEQGPEDILTETDEIPTEPDGTQNITGDSPELSQEPPEEGPDPSSSQSDEGEQTDITQENGYEEAPAASQEEAAPEEQPVGLEE